METTARYVLIGLFSLAVVVTGFGFVFWLHQGGGLGERTTYRIRFESPVPGLRPGSSVLFNGIRVGEATELRLSPDHPRQVMATIVVDRTTPVRADTEVGVEAQGLMGAPSIVLRGGEPGMPPPAAAPGQPAVLVADPSASLDTMQAAREALRRLNSILGDNAEPLNSTIVNLKTFTGALARNSDRVDGLLDSLERMTGGGPAKPAPAIYELHAVPGGPGLEKIPAGQLVVADPTTTLGLETQKIVARSETGITPAYPDAQWSDSIAKLVQARLVQSFENAGYSRVGRPQDGLTADHQLLTDIRQFAVLLAPQPVAEVAFAVKIVDPGGRILDARIVQAKIPLDGSDAAAAAAALDAAFRRAAGDLVAWTINTL
jgi:phospholipid/cholesterol/gamma-HCH transport system substrate-binding protein